MFDLDLELEYTFIPSKIPSNKLMIVLHGRGDSSQGFMNLPNFLNIDELNYILFDAPFEYFSGYSWYQLPPNQLPGIEYSKKILTHDLDKLFEADFDASESFLFGFSQGSLLTFEFGARYHKTFAGYIAVSGYVYDAELLIKEMNQQNNNKCWFCSHGTYDQVLSYEESKLQIDYLIHNGFDIEFHTYVKDHSIDRDELETISQWIQSKLSNNKESE